MRVAMKIEQGLLHCPGCGCAYLHHDKVVVYRRQEDADIVERAVVGEGFSVNKVLNKGSGNPSSRRDGLTIRFWCEGCQRWPEMQIAQHKGQTQVEWAWAKDPPPRWPEIFVDVPEFAQ